ncbi:hypothetical protein COCMIDRAFT_81112 [Bipolaris oryzae ATCC 44560]|uniref:Histone H4 n=1 Tax=Bipolaris oryzae ATCC 44560 TaxID=930090 RepID=W6ZG63_COCMI|nr:uncharacterized protein COCMIDRAFT_81112 [Bipolaris oryzae ATCC 44560]EUC50802.1 hypothetical protein COCMIDRAFT_81112 [Bipolaris oryzae ATCC 44560]
MSSQRPNQYSAIPRYTGVSSTPRPQPPASSAPSRATQLGLGLGRGAGGLGKSALGRPKGPMKRHMKVQRDSIHGITKGDIRRLARRGGVKRISAIVYSDIRQALRERLARILKDICAIIDSSGRQTVAVTDVVFALQRLGNPIYGFEPSFLRQR